MNFGLGIGSLSDERRLEKEVLRTPTNQQTPHTEPAYSTSTYLGRTYSLCILVVAIHVLSPFRTMFILILYH